MMKRLWIVAWLALAASAQAAATVHSTDLEFRTGSGDGNVDIGAGDGDGSLRLAKLAGTLGAWSNAASLPTVLANNVVWSAGNRLFIAGGILSDSPYSITSAVRYADVDGTGNLGAWALQGQLPVAGVAWGFARWGDRLFIAGRTDESLTRQTQVYSATLDGSGMPGAWQLAGNLPSTDTSVRILAEYGRLYYVAGGLGTSGSTDVYAAEILKDGTLGSFVLQGNSRNQSNRHFFISTSMGSLITMGGETSNWAGETTVERAVVSAIGLGAWANQSGLPAGRSYAYQGHTGYAGKLFVAGGKTYAGSDILHNTVFSSTLASGGIPGTWGSESSLPANRAYGQLIRVGSWLWYLGGVSAWVINTEVSDIYRAALNQSTANAAQGVYVNRFDLGSDQSVLQFEVDRLAGTPASAVEAQVRTATSAGSFGAWTALAQPPIAINSSVRYVEYRLLFSDPGGGTDTGVTQVRLTQPVPTATPTPVPTSGSNGPYKAPEGEATAFPNPAKGAQTKFGFELAESGRCTLTVWTAAGVLASQVSDSFGPGKGLLRLNIKDYAPGVYLYQLVIDYDSGRKVTGPVKRFAVAP